MKPVSPPGGLEGIESQHFGERFEKAVVGKEQCNRENVVGLINRSDRHTNAAAADIDGFLGELALCRVGLKLNADGQRDGDAIILPPIFPGWL